MTSLSATSASTTSTSTTSASDRNEADNIVHLRGVLAADAVTRELPSGDILVSFRLTVRRPPGERTTVDSIDCIALRAAARRAVDRAAAGDVLEVGGTLQRRFWRGPAGPASRYAVAVTSVRRVRRADQGAVTAGRSGAASRSRKPASG